MKTRGKFLVDAIEAAIGEKGNDVAGSETRRDGVDDRIDIGQDFGGSALRVERANDFVGMEALGFRNALLLVDAGENNVVGEAEAGNEIRREDLAAESVGARLEYGPRDANADRQNEVCGAFREWPWDGAQNPR